MSDIFKVSEVSDILKMQLEGINKVGRLHYNTTGTSLDDTFPSSLIITNVGRDGSSEGTLIAESTNEWAAAIGGVDAPEYDDGVRSTRCGASPLQ